MAVAAVAGVASLGQQFAVECNLTEAQAAGFPWACFITRTKKHRKPTNTRCNLRRPRCACVQTVQSVEAGLQAAQLLDF